MRQYRMMETKAGKIAFGIFLFAMLLLARDTLITTAILGFSKSQFLMLGLICVYGFVFLVLNRRELKGILLDRRITVAVISAVILLLPMLVKQDWQMMYFSILICLFFAVFLTYFTSYREVAKYYIVILSALCVYSLIASYVLKYLAFYGMISAPVFYNASGWDFYNFGLGFAVTWQYWVRNFGIFREPGVYQFFIIIAMYLNNYAVSWKKNWQMWLINGILIVTMVTTLAIGGYIEMVLFIVFLYFDKKWYQDKRGKAVGIAVLVLAVAAVAHIAVKIQAPNVQSTIYIVFYDMVVRLTSGSDSLVDRLDAILTNMSFFLENPIFGDTIAEILHGTNHNTSSTLILYAVFGVVGGTLNVASWIALAWRKERNLFGNLVLMVILFMSFNTQNLVADIFFWLFPYMALVEWAVPRLKFPERK